MEVSTIDNPVQEESTEIQSYVKETSVPLRVLYQFLVDLYDNAYPIPFIDFRKTFDRYMKATQNNIFDAIVLLIYGAKDIKKIGTGTEEISVNRLVEGREKYSEEVKTVKTPFYRFIGMDDEIRIGYDYATVIDFIDHTNETTDQVENINDVIESDDIVRTRVIPRFPMYINTATGAIIFDFNDSTTGIVNVKDMKFIIKTKGTKYELTDITEIEIQPVPKDCSAIRSVVINGNRIIVTELDNDMQFCYNAEHMRFEIIDNVGNVQYEYII